MIGLSWLLIAALTFSLVIHVEASFSGSFYARHRRVHRYRHIRRRSVPVKTTARYLDCIVANPDGQIVEPTPPQPQSDFISGLLRACSEDDFESFQAQFSEKELLSAHEAFILYRELLLSGCPSRFNLEVAKICRPVLPSPCLAGFLLRNLSFLPEVFDALFAEKDRMSGFLLDEALATSIDEESFAFLLRYCNVNALLPNGYPLIYHVIYHSNLPDYFLKLTLNHPYLDLSVKRGGGGSVPALWRDLPLLLHAWIYNSRAFVLLAECLPAIEMIPTLSQVMSFLRY